LNSKLIDHSVPLIRAVVLHPDLGERGARPAEERLEEAAGLARALDLDVRAEEVVRLRKTTPATLFGAGKVEEIAALIRAAEAAQALARADALYTPLPGASRTKPSS
jgi:GTP-binding protein HflX